MGLNARGRLPARISLAIKRRRGIPGRHSEDLVASVHLEAYQRVSNAAPLAEGAAGCAKVPRGIVESGSALLAAIAAALCSSAGLLDSRMCCDSALLNTR